MITQRTKPLTMLNGFIHVRFDPLPLVGGLVMPERYLIQEADKQGEHNAYGITTDRRLINPQTCTNMQTGERLFVHYGAYELRKDWEEGTCFIPGKTVMATIDPLDPIEGSQIGEVVYSEDIRTQSGIILKEGVREGVKVKILHGKRSAQTIITTDDKQYTFRYENKQYIYVQDKYIIGIENDGEIYPEPGYVLAEYLPDDDLQERMDENDRRSRLRDFMDKNYLHYPKEDLEPLKEPESVKAVVVRGDLPGEILVNRGHGTPIGNQWLIHRDNILGVVFNG